MAKTHWYQHENGSRALRLPGTGRRWLVAALALGFAGLLFVLLAGDRSLPRLVRLAGEENRLRARLEELKQQNDQLRLQIRSLKDDPRAVAPIARSELGLVYPGEILYRFVPTSPAEDPAPASGSGRP